MNDYQEIVISISSMYFKIDDTSFNMINAYSSKKLTFIVISKAIDMKDHFQKEFHSKCP